MRRIIQNQDKGIFVLSTGSYVSSTGSLQKSQIDFRKGPEGWEYVHEAYTHPCFNPSPLFHHLFPYHCASFMKTVFSTRSSVFLQETSCRTFGRMKFNFKRESNGGNLLVRPASTSESIPRLSPSFFHLIVLHIVLLQEVPLEIVGS